MNGIQRIQASFKKHKAFIAYLTAGDGGIQQTLAAAKALIQGGVTLLEIGVPFSDPIADGPVIQRASARALAAGTTFKEILWLTKEIRQMSDIPLVLFSYLNPLLTQFQQSFFQNAADAGIDGILLVDCPLEESGFFKEQCLASSLAPIFVIAPTTPLSRIRTISTLGEGFLYYACRKGTTGIQNGLPDDFAEKMQLIKSQTTLPVVAGFGIAERETARQVLKDADGVVIGSLFVKAIEEGASMSELAQLTRRTNPL